MTTAADVADAITDAETGAVVAASAAQVAVQAADAAVLAADIQIAQVVHAASVEIQQAVETVRSTEEEVLWLREKTNSLQAQVEAQNLATLERISSLETTVLEMTALALSAASPSPIQAPEVPTLPQTPPESAVALPEVPANPAPEKKLLRRL